MLSLPGAQPTALPTQTSLWVGRAFTSVILALVVLGAGLAVFDLERSAPLAAGLFASAAILYSVMTLLLFWRGDYILRMFGCAWPIVLAKVDEFQRTQRERAFAFTFSVGLTAFTGVCSIHVGMLLAQWSKDRPLGGLLPTDPIGSGALLVLVLFLLTLLPQAYLAWTLSPLSDDEA